MVKTTFPMEALPQPVAAFVHDLAEAFNVSIDLVAPIALAELAGAIGASRELVIRPGWAELPALWAAIVAAPGQMKSPTQAAVLRPMRRWQAQRFHDFEIALQDWRLAVEEWQDTPKRDRGSSPERPRAQRSLISDITIEALAPVLTDSPRGVLADVDELSGWARGMGQYKSTGRGADRSKWLEIWPSHPITIDRKSAEAPVHVRRPYVSIVGGIQPRVLADMEEGRPGEDGLLDRFLFSVPTESDGKWSRHELDFQFASSWERIILTLLDLRMTENGIGLEPHQMFLDAEAQQLFAQLNDEHAEEARDPNLPVRLINPYSKVRGYAARLALVIHETFVACGTPQPWTASVVIGWALADWFKEQARQAYGIIEETAEDRVVAAARRWIIDKGGEASIRDIVRANVANIRKSSDAEALVSILEDRGLAAVKELRVAGGTRRVVYLLQEAS